MWVLVVETRISELRFPENKSPGRILLSAFWGFFLLHVYRTDPAFGKKKKKVCVSVCANIDE